MACARPRSWSADVSKPAIIEQSRGRFKPKTLGKPVAHASSGVMRERVRVENLADVSMVNANGFLVKH